MKKLHVNILSRFVGTITRFARNVKVIVFIFVKGKGKVCTIAEIVANILVLELGQYLKNHIYTCTNGYTQFTC